MFKGIYTIYKRKAHIIDGEWVAGEITEIIEEPNDILIGYWDRLHHLYPQWYKRNMRVFVSEFPHTGALSVQTANTTEWIKGDYLEDATWTPATTATDGYWEFRSRFQPPVSQRQIRSFCAGATDETDLNLSLINVVSPCIQETDEILDVFYRIYLDTSFLSADGLSPSIIETLVRNIVIADTDGVGIGAPEAPSQWGYYPAELYVEQLPYDIPGVFTATYSNMDGISTAAVGEHRWSQEFSSEFLVKKPTLNVLLTLAGSVPGEASGNLFRSISFGNQRNRLWRAPIDKGTTSSIQNTFKRAVNDGSYRDPFLDIDNLATSVANVIVSDPGTWASQLDEPFAHHYRIEMTTGGLTGVATYKFRRRRLTGLGFAQPLPTNVSLLTHNPRGLFTANDTIDGTDNTRYGQIGYHAEETANNCLDGARHYQRYVFPEFLSIGPDGVTINDVNGTFENIDSTSSPALNCTDILQVANDGSTILVACGNTGLFEITRTVRGTVSSITQITPVGITNPNSCKGVCVKTTDEWYALFQDNTDSKLYLAKTTDGGSNWTLYDETTGTQFLLTNYTSGSPGPNNVIGLHIDPNHVDNRFFVQASPTLNTISTSIKGFWWSEANSNPTSDQVSISLSSTYAAGLSYRLVGTKSIKPLSNNQWIVQAGDQPYYNALLNWGSGTVAAIDNTATNGYNSASITNPLIIEDSGTTYMVGSGTFGNPSHTGGIALRTPANYNTTTIHSYLYDGSSPLVTQEGALSQHSRNAYSNLVEYIGNGVFVGKVYNEAAYLMSFVGTGLISNDLSLPIWDEYGWNGSAWELDNPGSKTTHSGDEALIDTLNIRFDDNGGTDPYVVNEYYDVYVYDGILDDNATEFTQAFYGFESSNETGTTFSSANVPASDVGATTNEPFALLFGGKQAARFSTSLGSIARNFYRGEPGTVIQNTVSGNNNELAVAEHQLVGDFEIRFKLSQSLNSLPHIGLADWTTIAASPQGFIYNSASTRVHMEFDLTGFDNTTGNINYTIRIKDAPLNSATTVHTENVVGGSQADVFKIKRVGSTITFERNDVLFYTDGQTLSQDFGIVFYDDQTASGINDGEMGHTFYDMVVDYTINRRLVEIGDGATTGASDPNFAFMPLTTVAQDLTINIGGVPATILTDGVTPPAAGEVNVLPYSGRLWFNSADAGSAITGTWRYCRKLNRV